ncbi:hypothetical protein B0T18DRAFT_81676 [Schizothecium vesticola]|uniref:Uncharacterized protein n=1 Tax=Schizothecium vesticola TaxID=314040 RepID=A0AA40F726_9PEZI|nr:hypothetical protein B0T18DRAFT_81676 [Schizothecium vesticola]
MGACNRPASWCVAGCAVLVLRARPEVCSRCLQLFVGPPFISSWAVPAVIIRLSRFSQNHSSTHRQTCLSHHLALAIPTSPRGLVPSHPAPAPSPSPDLVADRRVFPRLYQNSASHPSGCLSQQPASLSCLRASSIKRVPAASNGPARLQEPAPPRNPGSTPLSDKALDEDDTALEAASSVPPSLQRPVSPARPCPPSLWHAGIYRARARRLESSGRKWADIRESRLRYPT